jgi:hypothetical protein
MAGFSDKIDAQRDHLVGYFIHLSVVLSFCGGRGSSR